MQKHSFLPYLLLVSFTFGCLLLNGQVELSGELRKWHKITLTIDGPNTSELANYNPFLHYRMDVTFRHDSATYVIPGYFAADGDAGNSSADKGNKWRAHFSPGHTGEWTWTVSFRNGTNVAVSDNPNAGEIVAGADGLHGQFSVSPSDKTGKDLRAKGRLLFHGRQYPVFAETGEYFIKSGTDAPENLLSYADFDGTFHNDGLKDNLVKTWAPHLSDWKAGDPTWKDGKGKALIGAINYLAGKGLNAFSFLTNNIAGDDMNVFPYVSYHNYERIDVSKMDQWEIVFSHGERLGMFLHFKLAEVENQGLLDGGDLGPQRKLYYRELMARFGHHLALNWNVGEENGLWMKKHTTPWQNTTQRLAMARYFYENDPYRHHVVIHNGQQFYDLLGPESRYTGLSYQTSKPDFREVYPSIRRWLELSKRQKVNWAIAIDEPGDAQHSLVPDADDDGVHDNARQNALWGAIMAGGWGSEWYFGYKHAHSDLSCEDFRSRDKFWDQVRYHLEFMEQANLPLKEMSPANELSSSENDWILAKKGEVYLVLLKMGEKPDNQLILPGGSYSIRLFNPRTGKDTGSMQKESPKNGKITLPKPPSEMDMDYIVLVRKI
ncbi:DUF5060 domain-containing protein [Neolewinella agarilytica]|uniref:DUF5060 domain-containing protein n=1 Tax=Neolewinella agarilytica TaxID=478744 RepID=A0A1H9KMG5_9BACT|nr:DUF5060 domain-containing protein [Neolewinella agarilytica]SER00356.1 protein of unknown function [Neolewinella agarilytica]